MKTSDVMRSWGRILSGYEPGLSIEITRECPLTCPGCYAYGPDHLGGDINLRQVSDYRGDALVQGVLGLIKQYHPLHVSIVGGEPLVRFRELNDLLPKISQLGIRTQLVTSAVRAIPAEWAEIPNLYFVVSIDGLQPEHDIRRKPATYQKILQNIKGHRIVVHCTITSQMMQRPGYLTEFTDFWAAQPETRKIWFSMFTPQKGETSVEILTRAQRRQAVEELREIRARQPDVMQDMLDSVLDGFIEPPRDPSECIFARVTRTITADLKKQITPCQFGGDPDCSNCGCIASAGMAALGRHKLGGLVPLNSIFAASIAVGKSAAAVRQLVRAQVASDQLTRIQETDL